MARAWSDYRFNFMGFYAEKDWGGTFEQVARIGMQDAIECIKEVCG